MSHQITLEVLTPIKAKGDVFNKLLLVRHPDGREGLLLCSELSRWPEELKEQADWLAGCYTPTEAPLNKLILGYHPRQQMKWKFSEGQLTLSLDQGVEEFYAFGVQCYRREEYVPDVKTVRSLLRLLRISGTVSLSSAFLQCYMYCEDSKKPSVYLVIPFLLQILIELRSDAYKIECQADIDKLVAELVDVDEPITPEVRRTAEAARRRYEYIEHRRLNGSAIDSSDRDAAEKSTSTLVAEMIAELEARRNRIAGNLAVAVAAITLVGVGWFAGLWPDVNTLPPQTVVEEYVDPADYAP